MTAVKLGKGQNTALVTAQLTFQVVSTPTGGIDTSALILGPAGHVGSDIDFIFYNQPKHPSGAIGHLPADASRGTDAIEISLERLPDTIDRVVIAASVDAGTVARYDHAALVVADATTGQNLFEFNVAAEGSESAIVLAEVYRRNGAWKLRAVSQGYNTGLAGLATDHGLNISDSSPTSELPPEQAPTKPPEPAAAASGSISYSRPSRASSQRARSAEVRDSAEGKHSPDANTPDTRATPGPRQRATAAPSGPPTSAVAHEQWQRTRRQAADQTEMLASTIEAATKAFEATRPSQANEIKKLDGVFAQLRGSWSVRFPKNEVPATPGSEPWSLTGAALSPGAWTGRAHDLIRELDGKTIKLTSDGRRSYRQDLARQFTEIAQSLPSVKARLRQDAWDRMSANGSVRAANAARDALQSWTTLPAPPAPIGLYPAPIADGAVVRGLGPTTVQVGWAWPTSITFSTERPATPNGRRAHTINLPENAKLPIVIDLDNEGGYVTGTPGVIEATAFSLLSALPPGQVKLDVFDPDKLGESANFLYGLGDAAEKVIGQKVRTTEKELADLLVEIEEHITFVTQKYLQGSFDSLTAYNKASGDVSEPYRLLVLYDYPSGFSRDQQYDKDQLDRLQKILGAGRRCGVFTLIAHSGSHAEYANQVSLTLPWLSRVDFNPTLVTRTLGLDSRVEARLRGRGEGRLADLTVHWAFEALAQPPTDIAISLIAHVERGLRGAADVRVDPDRVSELARLAMQRDVARGTRPDEPIASAFEPASWWQGSTVDDVTAVVGRLGASDTARIRLDSQTASSVLIGGRPGSGKSVLLHALIMSLTQQYGPDELSLFLVDFKEGVEFKQYATNHLPQAKVVAIESEREFGVSVLESLAAEIVRRGQLFRDAGSGEETNIGHYRRRTGLGLPRVVLVIDEFQVMFDRDDKVGNRAAELLERVLRTGRAFGVHVILASQTIAGMPALGRHLPNLIPTRVVLQSADADSRLLLSEDNADAKLLSRPGEAILNTKGGIKDANQRFQSTYWSPEDRGWVLEHLRLLAHEAGQHAMPVVFEGQRGAAVTDVPPETFTQSSGKHLALPLGTPMTLAGPVRAELRREPGSNLLIVGDDAGPLLVNLGVLGRAATRVEVLDFGGSDDGAALEAVTAHVPTTRVSRRREVRDVLSQVADAVHTRLEQRDYSETPCVLVIHGLHRAREFDTNAEFEEGSESALLKQIVRDGPEVGVHVIAWVDKKTSVDRRMSYDVLREFALRLCGPTSREDSLALIDTDDAATLHPGQAIFDDHDQSKRYRLRVFSTPDADWGRDLLRSVRT